MTRTKVLATLGPATSDVDTLLDLFKAGADLVRLNFSHGTLDDHLQILRNVREAAARHDRPVAVLGDLCGPKIRLGQVRDTDGDDSGVQINVGDTLILQRQDILGDREDDNTIRASCTYPQLIDDIHVGHRVLIEDGLLRFICIDQSANALHLQCNVGGRLKSRKGINLPATDLNLPSITDYDWQCVEWAIKNELDFLALSFVRQPNELQQLREHLQYNNSPIDLVAKIEKGEALEQIDAIIAASDALMIARGDLGVEVDVARVPIIQKDLIRKCQTAGKPVIVATQMLQSMIENASPTRAEVSDVANAIFDGADAVMLSGETSVGKFPIGAVHVMNRVAEQTERYLIDNPELDTSARPNVRAMRLSNAIASGVRQLVKELGPKLVVVYSQTGDTARIFSKHRLPVPLVALSSNHRTLRQMALHFGTLPIEMPAPPDLRTLVGCIDELLISHDLAANGDRTVIVAGASMGTPGAMNGVVVHTVGAKLHDV
ncbi:MAG: pyruvate kinase [Planctomycetota bacterium]